MAKKKEEDKRPLVTYYKKETGNVVHIPKKQRRWGDGDGGKKAQERRQRAIKRSRDQN